MLPLSPKYLNKILADHVTSGLAVFKLLGTPESPAGLIKTDCRTHPQFLIQ